MKFIVTYGQSFIPSCAFFFFFCLSERIDFYIDHQRGLLLQNLFRYLYTLLGNCIWSEVSVMATEYVRAITTHYIPSGNIRSQTMKNIKLLEMWTWIYLWIHLLHVIYKCLYVHALMQASYLLSCPGLPVLIVSEILTMVVGGNKVKSWHPFFEICSDDDSIDPWADKLPEMAASYRAISSWMIRSNIYYQLINDNGHYLL